MRGRDSYQFNLSAQQASDTWRIPDKTPNDKTPNDKTPNDKISNWQNIELTKHRIDNTSN